MEWEYKKTKILFEKETGLFAFFNRNKKMIEKVESLNEAKRKIDVNLKDYYDFKLNDIKALLKKLDNREKDFVVSLIEELECHEDNAYCELGIYNYFLFEFGFTEFLTSYNKNCK